MTSYVTGNTVKTLREKKGITQKQLADEIGVSDKTISKWETQKGLPDISLLEPLASALNVSVSELLTGNLSNNSNVSGNMKKVKFYVCPICGNIIQSTGEGTFSCCGVTLPVLEADAPDAAHEIKVEKIENDHYILINHPMSKTHFISFLAYVTADQVQLVKLYPEQNAEKRIPARGHGILYAYCNQHGLFSLRI